MSISGALGMLGVWAVVNVLAYLSFGMRGFPLDVYDTRWGGEVSPIVILGIDVAIAVALAVTAGRVIHVMERDNERMANESARDLADMVQALKPDSSAPRSDHEYLRVEAVNVDGRRLGVMIGVSYGDPVHFSLRFLDDDVTFSIDAADAFAALNAARAKYEPQGWRFLCNGARRDCYTFGAQLAADRGEQVYPLKPGKPAAKDDLVSIFSPADEAAVGTLDEQRDFFVRWQNA